jgi:hypothetical protein
VGFLFSDQCREDFGAVGLDRRVNCIRDVNSMTLRELIDSDLESGLEFSFILCPLFDALLSRRKLACSRRP